MIAPCIPGRAGIHPTRYQPSGDGAALRRGVDHVVVRPVREGGELVHVVAHSGEPLGAALKTFVRTSKEAKH